MTASTLLVPGYIDEFEVENIARFIAEVDNPIPYYLLAFYLQYVMSDLPTTNRKLAYSCLDATKKHLPNIKLGTIHLIS